jgi:hypothetical protein
MNVKTHEAGEEVDAGSHGCGVFPFLESDAVRSECGGDSVVGIREVAVRIRVQESIERSFNWTRHPSEGR